MVLGQIGSLVGLFFFVLVFVLFIYILFSNLVGLIPYSFATTAHLVSTTCFKILCFILSWRYSFNVSSFISSNRINILYS
jgi:F-type H+-transporting ATPase subunit a